MICFPNAKINIGLNVIEKRSDGYHNIESVFYPVKIYDVLEVITNDNSPRSEVKLFASGIPITGNVDDNLCIMAYGLLAKDFDLPAVNIYLHKIIPMGAGMGGGSADAAFLIRLLNDKYKLGLDTNAMTGYASRIGSDCAFFINNKPAFAEGRGEKLNEIDFSLAGYKIWIIKPDVHVSTKDAYSMLSPVMPKNKLTQIVKNEPIEKWKGIVVNDFEKEICSKYPIVKEVKNFLYSSDAVYASMTGSGSAVYGLFKQNPPGNVYPFTNVFSWKGELI